jgi:hypothetical protein
MVASLVVSSAEDMPVEDASVPFVVTTLVVEAFGAGASVPRWRSVALGGARWRSVARLGVSAQWLGSVARWLSVALGGSAWWLGSVARWRSVALGGSAPWLGSVDLWRSVAP